MNQHWPSFGERANGHKQLCGSLQESSSSYCARNSPRKCAHLDTIFTPNLCMWYMNEHKQMYACLYIAHLCNWVQTNNTEGALINILLTHPHTIYNSLTSKAAIGNWSCPSKGEQRCLTTKAALRLLNLKPMTRIYYR